MADFHFTRSGLNVEIIQRFFSTRGRSKGEGQDATLDQLFF